MDVLTLTISTEPLTPIKDRKKGSRFAELALVLAVPSRVATNATWAPRFVMELFNRYGIPFTAWEAHFGFGPGCVSRMLNVGPKAVRGETHKAAVLLGLKIGTIVELNKERRDKMAIVLGDAVKSVANDGSN